MRASTARARLAGVRVGLATLVVLGPSWALRPALAWAQGEAESTVRPGDWPQAGQWPVRAWVVVLVGVLLVVLVLVGLARAIRRRGRR